jgi:hypothetical protein
MDSYNKKPSAWASLRWPIKAILIAAPIVALLYYGMQNGWSDKLSNLSSQTGNTGSTEGGTIGPDGTVTNQNTTGGNTNTSTTSSTPATNGGGRIFNYTPAKPVNGTLKGIVEVGASGFNSFVVNIDKEKNWEIRSKDFGQSFVYEGLATTDDIRLGLKKYIVGMSEKGVKNNNVHFVISSGAQKEPKTAIIASELKKMGYVVNLVTAEQEGKLALKSVLPKAYYDNSFVVDIGSGNTKISFPNASGVTSMEAAGAKYYEKDVADATAYADVTAKAKMVPANKREVCFIIGGVPFELAKQTRNGEERYTVLNNPNTYKAGDKKKTACGINIYKALVEATGCDTFVFDWDANFSIGFLLGLP